MDKYLRAYYKLLFSLYLRAYYGLPACILRYTCVHSLFTYVHNVTTYVHSTYVHTNFFYLNGSVGIGTTAPPHCKCKTCGVTYCGALPAFYGVFTGKCVNIYVFIRIFKQIAHFFKQIAHFLRTFLYYV